MKKKNIFTKLFAFILAFITLIFILSLISLNILTTKYLLIIAIILITINIISSSLLILKKKKRILAYLLNLLLITILSLGSFYILKTNGILEGFNKNYKTYNYSVAVLKNSNYKEIDDINNQTLGYYQTDTEECTKSLEKINNIITTIQNSYNDIYSLATSLLNNEIEAILIEDSYLSILKENDTELDELNNFNNQIEIIYTFSIKININDISSDVDVTKEVFNVYISGIDTYGSVSSVSRSDVNIIATINPKTKQILLTSIPRDYYVSLHNKTGYKDKLTHAGLYGIDMSINTIEDLLDIKINYYIKVNFTSIIDIVDSIGGVDVYSDYTFTSIDGYNYRKGYNSVNGNEALSFVRERKAFQAGDRQRIKNQQALIEALVRKCISTDIIIKYNSLLNSLKDSFVTNMPIDRITDIIKMQISNNVSWNITSNSLNGTDSSNYTYSIPNQKSYVMEPIEESISNAIELINRVEEGEVLESSYNSNSSNVYDVTKNNTTQNNSANNIEQEEESNEKEESNEGLKASLIKDSISFAEGDEYIYHGFTATYNKEDITDLTEVTYAVNGATFDNYKDLISYVSNLAKGQYQIIYNIKYEEDTIILTQNVNIEELLNNDSLEEEEKEDDNMEEEENNELTQN